MITFTWRKIYATAIGWAIGFALIVLITTIYGIGMGRISAETIAPGLILSLAMFALIIASVIFSIAMSRKINRTMMSKAVKNHQVIRDFLNGVYDDKIPAKMNTEAGKQRILGLLCKGQATSVRGAVWMARKKKADKVVFGGLFAIFGLIFSAADRIVSDAVADYGHVIGESIGNFTGKISDGTLFDELCPPAPPQDNTWKITREKNKAAWMENRANNAAKAAPGSYQAQRARELAAIQRKKANNMWKQV